MMKGLKEILIFLMQQVLDLHMYTEVSSEEGVGIEASAVEFGLEFGEITCSVWFLRGI